MSDRVLDAEALPVRPAEFWSCAGAEVALSTGRRHDLPLRRLGPSPFTGSGFPVLGLLETVYEHVMERTRARWQTPAQGAEPANQPEPAGPAGCPGS